MRTGDEQMAKSASYFWAQRIEGGPAKSCFPKKKLRAAGLLPPVPVPGQTLNQYLAQFKIKAEDIPILDAMYDGPKQNK
jgi:hypothetical protein